MRNAAFAVMLSLAIAGCAQQAEEEAIPSADTTVTSATEQSAPAQKLDPNSASEAELATVPGVDAALASEIVAKRPYADMRAVDAVLSPRLSEEQRDSVYAHLWQPVDVNKATKEELELIPGVGPRMSGEFEEYRPFTSEQHFRTEIGKYVDAAELDRLLSYIVIR